MKYIVLIGDGMADYPLEELEGKTPLQVAKTPNMDSIVKRGKLVRALTVPKGFKPASDVACLSILSYDPRKYYAGRGPLEAANMGIDLKGDEVAFRCNLITASDDILSDFCAGHITNKEAKVLMELIDEKLGSENVRFYPGISYRHLMVVNPVSSLGLTKEGLLETKCTPPHDITGQSISKNMPKGDAGEFLSKLMEKSKQVLADQEINKVRIDLKENPANMIWLWGQGAYMDFPKFYEKYNLEGAVISAVDLINGIGKLIGLEVIKVPGATGYYDTNYKGKAEYALKALRHKDFVFVHVEAPDEAGHNGDLRAKITAIENFDSQVVGTVLEHYKDLKDVRVLVMPDHATPVSVKTHTADPVFFAMAGEGIERGEATEFNEAQAAESKEFVENGYQVLDYFIKGQI